MRGVGDFGRKEARSKARAREQARREQSSSFGVEDDRDHCLGCIAVHAEVDEACGKRDVMVG